MNFRDSELQARLGLITSGAGAFFVLLQAYITLENFNLAEKSIAFNPQTLRYPAILLTAGLAGLLAGIGFVLGVSSLGHKRNNRQRESWIGFLLGALVICLVIVLFVMFKMFGLTIIT